MRILLAALAVLAALVVGIAALAVLNLRALVGAQHDRIVARLTSVIGRPTDVGAIVPSWWPLGVRLRDVTIGEDPAFGTAPFLRADGVVMSVRPWPLVHGRIEVAGVILDHPRVAFVRDLAGRWNVESLGEAVGGSSGKSKESRFAFRLPLEWVVGVALSEMRDGLFTIEDRHASPPVHLAFGHMHAHAEDVRFGATAHVRVDVALFDPTAPDAHLDLRIQELGQNDAQHTPFTARLEVADGDLGMLAAGLGKPRLGSGRVRRLAVDADGTLERTRATIEAASADPELRIGRVAVGRVQPVEVRAVLTRVHDRITIEDARATVGTLAVRAHGDAAEDPPKVTLDVTSEENGVATLALEHTSVDVRGVAGRVTFERDGTELAPLTVRIDDVPLAIKGWITGADPPTFDLHVDARPFAGTVAADLALDAGGAVRARIDAEGIDLAPATARIAPELAGRIEGKARGAAVASARLAGGELVSGSLTGDGTLEVTGGRIRDVNLPNLVVDRVERVPLMPTLVSTATRARYAELFGSADTVIESARVPFTLGRGQLATEHALLVNPGYQVVGDGWIDENRALRFRGTVLLGASVSRTLREDVHAAKYLAGDDGRIELPFLARGRLDAVRVEPDTKRLRVRGLEALLGAPPDGSAPPKPRDKRAPREHDEELEHEVIDRLQKLLRP